MSCITSRIFTHGGDYSQLPRKDTSLVVYDGEATRKLLSSQIDIGMLRKYSSPIHCFDHQKGPIGYHQIHMAKRFCYQRRTLAS